MAVRDATVTAPGGELARAALGAEPASGHAVHALTHVHYESGEHRVGRDWLDGRIGGQGRRAVHRAHFSWHVALHEPALDDTAAVRRRWSAQLTPGQVNGVRALADSGSLLWRARMSRNWTGRVPADGVLDAVARDLVERSTTAFTALHSAVVLTAVGDLPALRRLRAHAAGADPVQRGGHHPAARGAGGGSGAGVGHGGTGPFGTAALAAPRGGSAAQREVVEEILLYALVEAGHSDTVRHLLEQGLDRRASPLDSRRLAGLRGWQGLHDVPVQEVPRGGCRRAVRAGLPWCRIRAGHTGGVRIVMMTAGSRG